MSDVAKRLAQNHTAHLLHKHTSNPWISTPTITGVWEEWPVNSMPHTLAQKNSGDPGVLAVSRRLGAEPCVVFCLLLRGVARQLEAFSKSVKHLFGPPQEHTLPLMETGVIGEPCPPKV